MSSGPSNVLGESLRPCCFEPVTGFYRDGYCRTGPGDVGLHTVCVEVTAEFLLFSRAQGNDLTTPIPEYEFPGLQPGDRWCLCVTRWKQALDAGCAPRVRLESTHISAPRIRGAGGSGTPRPRGRRESVVALWIICSV